MIKKILITALFVAVAYHYLKKIPSEITGFKTFSNTKFSYSFKYPKDWVMEKHGDNYVMVMRNNPEPALKDKNRSLTSVTIEQVENPLNLNLFDLFKMKYAEEDKWLKKAGAADKVFEDVTFVGQKALKITTPGLLNCQYFFKKESGDVLSVAIEIFGDEADAIYLEDAKNIVKSFKLD